MDSNYLNYLIKLRDKAIINRDMKSVNKYNDQIDIHLSWQSGRTKSSVLNSVNTKSSRFLVGRQKPNVSRESSSMGYAKPIHNQRISSKYNCMVTGEKRMEPCAECSTVKSCISKSMQYKEQET
jgi:hypothetical protein